MNSDLKDTLVNETKPESYVLEHVSPSQLNMWMRCQKQWRFRYIDGLIIPTAAQLLLGSAYHSGLEFNYTNKIESKEDMPADEVIGAFADKFEARADSEEIDWRDSKPGEVLDRGVALTRCHMQTRAPEIQPVEVETRKSITLPSGIELLAILDLKDDRGIIRDHKTGKRKKSQGDLDKDTQATANLIVDPDATGFGWETAITNSKGADCQFLETSRSQAEKDWYLANIEATIKQIQSAIQTGIFVGNTNGWHCGPDFCGWFNICKPRC
ncbi:MAG: PD-(D/E)XK nuclease family protein [Actinobacteria bacterium]|nr:PD-(D/E)XK nuclease family protein [Actinomycetota bacterium]